MAFEYCRASIRHLDCTNVFVYIYIYAHVNVFACVTDRSGENNCMHGYRDMSVFANTSKCVFYNTIEDLVLSVCCFCLIY